MLRQFSESGPAAVAEFEALAEQAQERRREAVLKELGVEDSFVDVQSVPPGTLVSLPCVLQQVDFRVDEAADILTLHDALSFLPEDSPHALQQQSRLLEVLEAPDGALQHHES